MFKGTLRLLPVMCSITNSTIKSIGSMNEISMFLTLKIYHFLLWFLCKNNTTEGIIRIQHFSSKEILIRWDKYLKVLLRIRHGRPFEDTFLVED